MRKNNNFGNIPSKDMDKLLKTVSEKLGTTPEVLQAQLRSGELDKAMSGMSREDTQKLTQALSDKETCAKVLSSPQAQAIIRKLSQGS